MSKMHLVYRIFLKKRDKIFKLVDKLEKSEIKQKILEGRRLYYSSESSIRTRVTFEKEVRSWGVGQFFSAVST